jgi:hypothetical protein
MGLMIQDDGWRVPDELWTKMEPLLPPRPEHPLGLPQPAVATSEEYLSLGREVMKADTRLSISMR